VIVLPRAVEFARLQPVNKEPQLPRFYQQMQQVFDIERTTQGTPNAVFSVKSIAQVAETTWSDSHATPRFPWRDRTMATGCDRNDELFACDPNAPAYGRKYFKLSAERCVNVGRGENSGQLISEML
jgi:hypothetical protein